jgi:glycosyltransferase involved in cell wall biosynthesis
VLARPRHVRDLQVVLTSGLFDPSWYLQRYPDVARGRLSPALHYVRTGRGEGRLPGPLFDTAFYLAHSPDVAEAGIDAFEHYLQCGSSEGRKPNAWFDPGWYRRRYPDVAASGEEPLTHYARIGWRESRDPSPDFSTAGYLGTHLDVAATGECPLAHYVRYGRHEGRLAPRADIGWATAAASARAMLDVRGSAGQNRTAPTLVCLSHALPTPPRAGNEIRVARLLERLRSRGYRVILVAAPLIGDEVDDARLETLAQTVGNVVVCERNGQVRYRLTECNDVLADLHGTLTGNYSVRLAESLARGPHAAEYLGIDRDFCHDVAIAVTLRLLAALRPETLLVEYVWMTRLLPLVDPGIVTVVDTHDVYSTKRDKVLTFGILDLDVPAEEEARRLGRADLVVAMQEVEATLLRTLSPGRPLVTAGIDFPIVRVPPATAPIVLYVASDNPMNTAGIADFLRFAWPRVLAACPDARLRVVGSISRSVPLGLPGVEVAGYVPDLADEYAGARVVINPAVAGTGLKIKTLEALAFLRPLVAWPNGVDGLPEDVLRLVPPATDWFEFADQVAERLARSGPVYDEADEAAIRTFLSPDAVYGPLEQALLDARARRNGPPA